MYAKYISFSECQTYEDRCISDLPGGYTDCSVEIYDDDERGHYEQEEWSLTVYACFNVYVSEHENKWQIDRVHGYVPFYTYGHKNMTEEQEENFLNLLRNRTGNPTLTFDTMDELVNSTELMIEEMYESMVSEDFFARTDKAHDDLDDVGYDERRL